MSTNGEVWIEHEEDVRRGFSRAIGISLAGHAVLILLLALAPSPKPAPLPRVIRASLVPMAPSPAAASKSAPSAAVAKPPATPKPPPPAPAPAAKPAPISKRVVLPKEPARVSTKKQKVVRRNPHKKVAYEDALAALREDLGEPLSDASESDPAAEAPAAEPAARSEGSGGSQVSPEVAAWIAATQRHLRQVWVTPPEFLNRQLVTELRVDLSEGGDVIGTPEIVRSSGDPFWDDNTIRALRRASPLPPPPESGEWPFTFSPQ